MTARRTRLLSTAEIEIWLKVAQSVTPRPGASLPEPVLRPAPAPAPPPVSPKPQRRPPPALPSYTPPVSQPRQPAAPPLVPLEKRFRQKVVRGGVAIDGVIDLHGLTQGQAHEALRGFLRGTQADGGRLVLVVTGKGRMRVDLDGAPLGRETGVLRRMVPHWLRAADLRAVVLGFEEASLPHGGLGALYVRLRRPER